MSAKLRLATDEDTRKVRHLVETAHEEAGLNPDPNLRSDAIDALLTGQMPGALYLVGPPSSPVGYIALSFGHSLIEGGTVATIDEVYIRPPIRGRGMATEALSALTATLAKHGVRAVHAAVSGDDALFRRLHFTPSPRGQMLTRPL